jgi:excisionase family DNA binding protein
MGDGSRLERLLTIREVAEQTGLSRDAIRDAAGSGELPAVRFSERGRFRIAPSALVEWIARHRHQPPPKFAVRPLVPSAKQIGTVSAKTTRMSSFGSALAPETLQKPLTQ